jgi:diguanylate cyclase (GGDEF)-like protein/PAS domain S-box-containing protein
MNAPASGPAPPWVRLHRTLLYDYNRKAATYWYTVVLTGAATMALSMWLMGRQAPSAWLGTAIGAAIAMLAGFFPVRVPGSKNSFAAGEIFIFLLLLVHGPEAAALAAAGEAAISSWRTSKRWSSRIVSPAMAVLAMFTAGSVLTWLIETTGRQPGLLIVAAMGFAVVYFALNALLVTAVPRLKRNETLQWSDLIGVFGWVGIAYAGSAAVASLLYLTYLQSGIGVLMAMVPLLAMLLATLHYFFRQQEAAEAVRQSNAEAAQREAQLAARHVRELEASERRFHSAFTHASIGMALLSFEGRVLQANEALRSLLGRADADIVGQLFNAFVWAEDQALITEALGRVETPDFDGFALDFRCRNSRGGEVWVSVHCGFFSEPGAGVPCLILQVQDISARRAAEAGLHHIAFHDSLTGLPNRRRFHELLGQAVERSRGGAGEGAERFAVMFLDFDRFKLINDSLGHSAGDAFLVQVAQRISGCLRSQDIVARLGGDEFAVLLLRLDHDRVALGLAERLLEGLKQPFQVAGTEIMTSASIGITFSSFGHRSTEDVLRDADTAMYKAKGAGKARYALFDASLHTEVADRLRLEGDLRRAIDEGQLTVAFQPIVDLASDRISGFEALARWNHAADGDISPSVFIPIAEEAGLILRLSDFVLNCACRQLAAWQREHPEGPELTVSVNISGNDVSHAAFVGRVTRALVETGLRARQLTLELTENILMSRLEAALPMLAELRQLGVALSVDDFGTGYSSLSHLSTLPIDSLKIDRSFVGRLHAGSKEAAVVRAIVLLGTSLGKTIVAEGVETEAQLQQLREMGCHLGQGFHLGRPMAPRDIQALLRAERGDVAPARASRLGDLRPLAAPCVLH